MILLNVRLFLRSFRYAWRGLKTAWAHEQNFRLQFLVGLAVVALMVIFPLERWEIVALVIIIMLVLVLELLNSMLEKLADVMEPRIHTYVRTIKDLMAALVLIASGAAVVVGLIIFLPYIF